jgi:hypothetical protein
MALAFICIMAVGGYMAGPYVGGDSGTLASQLLAVAGVLLAVIIIMVARIHPI